MFSNQRLHIIQKKKKKFKKNLKKKLRIHLLDRHTIIKNIVSLQETKLKIISSRGKMK